MHNQRLQGQPISRPAACIRAMQTPARIDSGLFAEECLHVTLISGYLGFSSPGSAVIGAWCADANRAGLVPAEH